LDLKKIDKSKRFPLYLQVKEIITNKIKSGEWKPLSKIPSESFLSEHNGISIMTVRQATNQLCEEGLLYKVHGKGTFVAKAKLERDLSELTSLTEKLKESGRDIIRKVLDLRVVDPPEDVADDLEIGNNESVIKLERLRIVDGKPFYYEISFLPFERAPGLLEEDFSEQSLYKILESKYGFLIDSAVTTIEAKSSDIKESELLTVHVGDPILHIHQITYTSDNIPIQYIEASARSDVFKYSLTRRRKH